MVMMVGDAQADLTFNLLPSTTTDRRHLKIRFHLNHVCII